MAVDFDDVKKVPGCFDRVLVMSEKVSEKIERWKNRYRWAVSLLGLVVAAIASVGVLSETVMASATVVLIVVLALTGIFILGVRLCLIETNVIGFRDDAGQTTASLISVGAYNTHVLQLREKVALCCERFR